MPRPRTIVIRAAVEIAFIIFLFYSNLLMGEFTVTAGAGKTWKMAVNNIFTEKNFLIALIAAVTGFVVFETLRNRTP